MYMCIFHYFNYYFLDFITSISLGFILVSHFWIFVLISLNAITNHLWNLCSWPEIKPWASGVGALTVSLDDQRTNPREYQIVRTHTQETTWIQDPTSPNHQQHPVQDASFKQQTKRKYKPNHQQDYHLTQPCPSEGGIKQLSSNLTLYEAYTNHWTNLRRAEIKRKKQFNLETWEKGTWNTVS